MALWHAVDSNRIRRRPISYQPSAIVAICAVLAAGPGAFIIWLIPAQPLLPILSFASLVSAGVAAALAWGLGAERHTRYFNLWDVAGAYAFAGFGAGMLCKSEDLLQLFGHQAPV